MGFYRQLPQAVFRIVLVVWLLVFLHTPIVHPATQRADAATEPTPVAQIIAIVVDGQLKAAASATEATVTRASDPSVVEPLKNGTLLFTNDKVQTFSKVSLNILFFTTQPDKPNEVTVGENSQFKVGSFDCSNWLCKWFADLKDAFDGRTRRVRLGNQGTKYELQTFVDGSVKLIVYEGSVVIQKVEESPSARLNVNSGRAFEIRDGRDGAKPFLRISSSQEPPAQILTVPQLVEVTIPPDFGSPQGARVETLPILQPITSEEQLREKLKWSSEIEIAAHPSNRAEENGVIARRSGFSDDTVRDEAFKEARVQSIWNQEPESFATLAKVYKDWGEGTKAVDSFDKAQIAFKQKDPGWQPPAAFLYDEAEAKTLVGRYSEAENLVEAAKAKDRSSGEDAALILGNIKYRQAEAARNENKIQLSKQFLNQAVQNYDLAQRVADPKYKNLSEANLGKAIKLSGDIALEDNNLPQAQLAYNRALKLLYSSYHLKPGFAFPEKAVADIYYAQGNLYLKQGKTVRANESFERSKQTYLIMINENKEFADALCGLAGVYLHLGQENQAQESFSRCLAYKPEARIKEIEMPDVEGRPKAVAIQILTDAGLKTEVIGEGDVVTKQDPARKTKVKVGSKVSISLGTINRAILRRRR